MFDWLFGSNAPQVPSLDDPHYRAAVASLEQLKRSHAFIDMCSGSLSHYVRSLIVEVDALEGVFLIDEPFPPEQGVYLVRNKSFDVYAFAEDGPVHFVTRVRDRHEAAEGVQYRCEIPTEIDRDQRRRDFRLAIGPDDAIVVELDLEPENQHTRADVINLSSGGIRLRLMHEEPWSSADLPEPECRLSLAEGGAIRCRLVMRNISIDEQHPNLWQVGASFANLERNQRRQLHHYIARRQQFRQEA